MDAVSYSLASKQAQRIEKFIENPDSTSGIVTVPSTIALGETVTIPAGRTAVLPNVQVDGTLNIDGEVFVPSGATFGDLENQIALKADTNYVDGKYSGFKNYIINGGFDVWQRGKNFTSQGYTADRWFGNLSGATGIFSKVSNDDISVLSNIRSNNRIRCVTTVANDYSGFFQKIEDVRTLSGKIATLSFWAYNAKSTQTLYLRLVQEDLDVIGNSNTELVSMPNGWTKVVATFNIPDIPNNTTISVNSCLKLFIVVKDNALVDFSICDVQLEEGSVATPFEQRPYGLELSLCKRYYQTSYLNGVPAGTITAKGAINFYSLTGSRDFTRWKFNFPVEMRENPTLTIYSTKTGSAGFVYCRTDGDLASSFFADTKRIDTYINPAPTTVIERFDFHYVADAEL